MDTDEKIVHRGKRITVRYCSDEQLGHYLGLAYYDFNLALVRANLPKRIKRFVRSHELHHLVDTFRWGGWLGAEIRATLVPGFFDPIGMFATVWYIIRRRGLKTYFEVIFLGKELPKPPNVR